MKILNGGLKKWLQESRPTFSGAQKTQEGGDFSYSVVDNSLLIMDIGHMHSVAR